MICHDNLKMAEEMGLDRTYALNCRKRYLSGRLWEIADEEDVILNDMEECPITDCNIVCRPDCRVGLAVTSFRKLEKERRAAQRELKVMEKLLVFKRRPDEITEEMIEQAREYPVDRLVDFCRGKATAWCHNDRNPSMYHATRKNLAVCPVCDKKFNPIDILIYRDGYTFPEAVKALI